ncbi:MAG TPA: sigma-70 family RNA polymerase sigma factor [Phycisphaerae bacterium]|nr:sigma-70 family RNA polymerase sigma factor [Phycisphaerae bacterium]
MHTTQTNLLQAVRDSQNREAWGSFYRIYAPMLRNFTRRMGLDDTSIEDLTQEVLMIAQRSLREDRYDPARGRFRTWLYGVARRQTLAAMRARRRRTRVQRVQTEGSVDLLAQLEDPRGEETAREIWRQEWRYALLEEALRHIRGEVGDKSFEAFHQFAIEHKPVQEVADRLGIAPASVYVYKSRVLDAIRQWVQKFEEE